MSTEELRAEMLAEVNQRIADLQSSYQAQINERNSIIVDLRAQLAAHHDASNGSPTAHHGDLARHEHSSTSPNPRRVLPGDRRYTGKGRRLVTAADLAAERGSDV